MLSAPSAVARTLRNHCLLIVPPITVSDSLLSTGRDSPVIIDSSILLMPERMIPSTGIRDPGLTRITSSCTTCSIGISISCQSRSTRAVFAWSERSFSMASPVWSLDLVSRYFP